MNNPAFDYINSCATEVFDPEKLESILSENPELASARDTEGETCLHQAATWHIPEAIKILVKYGANLNQKCDAGWTPLIACVFINSIYQCEDGALECVRLLIDLGADKYICSNDGLNAIDHARKTQFDRSIYYYLTSTPDTLEKHSCYRPDLIGKLVTIETKESTDFVFSHTATSYEFGRQILSGKILRYTRGIYETDVSAEKLSSNCLLVIDSWPDDYLYIHIDDIESIRTVDQ